METDEELKSAVESIRTVLQERVEEYIGEDELQELSRTRTIILAYCHKMSHQRSV